MNKPTVKPKNPCFSSGPCAKRPGWALANLDVSMMGRSHRAAPAKAQLKAIIDQHKELLGIPADYLVGIVPASDTGAVEMALWSLLGPRGVDIFAWESFGTDWLKDVTTQLKLPDVRTFSADYGALPDLTQASPDRDIVFTWNGTTSGVRVPNGDWIAADRAGLTICDATSAVFAYDVPWHKLDVTTWSWQKVLGSEGAHGMIVLSPRAVARLESYAPPWPMPKIFRMTAKGKINRDLFEGATINTPSMLAAADCLDALAWVKDLGGYKATMARTQKNFDTIADWVIRTGCMDFLAMDPATRSHTSVCLVFKDAWFHALDTEAKAAFVKALAKLLDQEGVGYDLASYRDAPAGLRLWGGATVEADDVAALLPWIEWAYETTKAAEIKKAA